MLKSLQNRYKEWVEKRASTNLADAILRSDVSLFAKSFVKVEDSDSLNMAVREIGSRWETNMVADLLENYWGVEHWKKTNINQMVLGAAEAEHLDNLGYLLDISPCKRDVDFGRLVLEVAENGTYSVLRYLFEEADEKDRFLFVNDAIDRALQGSNISALRYLLEALPVKKFATIDTDHLSRIIEQERARQIKLFSLGTASSASLLVKKNALHYVEGSLAVMESRSRREAERIREDEEKTSLPSVQAAALALVNKFFD